MSQFGHSCRPFRKLKSNLNQIRFFTIISENPFFFGRSQIKTVIFSRESKYEIKGSKSRSVGEKNVLYSNLKNAICKGKS